MFLTFQFDLRPSRAQHRTLEGILEGQRLLYNAALDERIGAWRKARVSVTKVDQSKSLTMIRADDRAGYGALPANLSRWTLKKVDKAFAGFFRRVKARSGRAGFPRFRPMSRWRSFGFSEFSGIRLIDGDKLLFKGMVGALKLHLHRPLPDDASIRSCTFSKGDKGWSVALQVETAAAAAHRHEDLAVGVDVGIEHLATLSTGEHVANPRFGAAAAPVVRRASRKLARASRGSRRRLKTRRQLLRLRRKVANRRKTYLHQVSASFSRRFGAIAVEDLSIKNMTRSAKGTVDRPGTKVRQKSGLNREWLDVGPATLISMIAYKAERAGGRFVRVDARGTSQTCSTCDASVPKDLSVRRHSCPHCETDLHRDVNAARNVLKRAVAGPWSGNADLNGNAGGEPHSGAQRNGSRRSGNLTATIAA